MIRKIIYFGGDRLGTWCISTDRTDCFAWYGADQWLSNQFKLWLSQGFKEVMNEENNDLDPEKFIKFIEFHGAVKTEEFVEPTYENSWWIGPKPLHLEEGLTKES